ncbi:F0F1 ATP synthase subunit B family protein [Acidocella aminolytica]|jgi:F-type H+-transporting ATPase subunit b|uniref:ATP synthase subunit b n=1 Tax=Acidocella aminolytica 101 = DSM 11237 TaxID=1120923 RepID=A0A0D6PH25_9PROT|nr:ATP synthase subunit B [Acidocella aminolytica]GAN80656.1 ATP synthase F0 subunit beta' [Acidocella aminolytica 101 = DSM 11237]GBQ40261.1 F0F1-type ATP synthase subunit beta [Acidocella aminolytica 101 = DSM 11237]SHE55029.1 F-type H+-transporting ATPase subunit b [Acidocella aminolytica 101 = DSM 11237]
MEYEALKAHFWANGTFWVTVAVLIFAFVAGRKVLGAIGNLLDARTKAVQAALDEAAQLKAEAEAILVDAKVKQEQAAKDAKHILATAHAEAERLANELAAEAEATARRREQMAMDRIQAAEAAAVKEVRAAAIDIATAASSAFLRDTVSNDTDAALIDHAITALPKAFRG